MAKNTYISGQYNVTCDVCSRKIKSGKARKRWDGFLVCADTCWEQRHPQDFVRAKQDKIYVPDTRPIPTLVFVTVPYSIYVDFGYVLKDYILENLE